ncbi:Uncharacterised protein (plasmid) [Legionella adelaidensis]|uniref:Uncharacterized protein n=1 Tax=Legionella adelaidensis TaxID=45056 RepID=A0A0W0R4N0_9GAMM|nr:hypothetical protein [Legionella adelaidensis]KTC66011.1 hypothetical protein Lade_0669 [Legionella adelaidensis]VEH85774.1 Uncharacterised protein [Legionella adelaidensis]
MKKWERFASQYSPVSPGNVNFGDNNLQMDWFRLAVIDATVDGISVKTWRSKYNEFASTEDVKQFFKEVILKDLKKEVNKDEVVDYLATAFHQGGLMFPVSASMSNMIFNEAGLQVNQPQSTRQIRITTNENGFKVQEVYTAKQVAVVDDTKASEGLKKQVQGLELPLVSPDRGNDFVFKAGACVDVDFSSSSKKPAITIESNFISYGNAEVQAVWDKRNFGQVIIDFFRNILGLNAVAVEEPKKVSEEAPTDSITPSM